jgi:hypothetical protein
MPDFAAFNTRTRLILKNAMERTRFAHEQKTDSIKHAIVVYEDLVSHWLRRLNYTKTKLPK